ncbi:fatty-acid--CoA ligase [Aurantimonas sp. C2-6-R+9]|uniref:fatty-acid--CoA ligase n=1 Tax=unclassified Aurantimonas TaxID=2638230 RepID=UPI002E18ACE5|nr:MULTISPECIES: fatty-acid--CoA ligase [unclassified Aurantimonas]MEC5289142.1 fatty-acid--CoA ligase [Aurantimonas sp. C2-3-R2]MEC5321854.1 fatty-acid--CoA ligase [Aurantimonas sp. A3-2-R12]MEC5379283.1 fatty-acid--CoA ligase [Aurantimonas sp. C2-6-R+9]MEC5410036.1 fatty-acid--CoA ligase [Aurantimonas sp. C2-4-R8]
MQGLMQQWPLLCSKVIDHAATYHPRREIVTRSVEGPIHRTNYSEVRTRSLQLAQRLERDGIKLGDRVATLAWNTWRHLECWYGILGIGAIYHTLNPRLFPDQIAWIMNDAEDRFIFVDLTFMPIIEAIAPKVPSLEKIIVLTDAAHMPETKLANVVCYEDWLAEADGDFVWKAFDENTAAGMCYTSGTTGNPKGVLYSHRSNVLHSMMAQQPDAMGLSSRDRLLPIVPLFHANGWGLALTCPMAGTAMVMPGAKMDGASVFELLTQEKVTFSAAVPTVWLMLLQHLEKEGGELPDLERVVIGGAACPRAVTQKFQDNYGVQVIHAWGMTEMSPLGSLCTIKPEYADLEGEALLDLEQKQGHPPFGVEMKVTDDANVERPWDGKTFGRLKVRGPAVASSYYKNTGPEVFDDDGWFDTGDVAHMDEHGYMQITDRAKDVIKSGGEWISTIDLENLAVGHPDVAEAAVIGLAHPKWDERPLLVIVRKEGREPSKEDILGFLEGKVAKWWMPDDVAFVSEIPHTATGKIQKTTLRDQFRDYRLPTA